MATFSAKKNASGMYDIYQDGLKISTGAASMLPNYGLSESNLNETVVSGQGNYTLPVGGNNFYGATSQNTTNEQKALTEERQMEAAASGSGLVSSSFLQNFITSKPEIIGLYVNAIAYGGYTTGDILNDIKRREMESQGDPAAKQMVLISPTIKRADYLQTPEGSAAMRQASTVIPTFNFQGLINPEILKYGANMPDALFSVLVPALDNTSQEFKDAVANTKSLYYDMLNAKLTAETEQEKSLADHNYNEFKSELERKYGIILSDDATKAWNQIVSLEDTYNQRNLQGSGLLNEEIDKYLRTTRLQDSRSRTDRDVTADSRMAAEMKASGSPAQIQAMINEDIAKGLSRDQWRATQWGLVPSQEALNSFSLEALQAKFPKETPETIKRYRDALIDENGNYRSTLYKNMYANINMNNDNQQAIAKDQVRQVALDKELAAYDEYTNNNPFSKSNAPKNADGTTPTAEQLAQRNVDAGLNPDGTQKGTPLADNELNRAALTKQVTDLQNAIKAATEKNKTSAPATKTPASGSAGSTGSVTKTESTGTTGSNPLSINGGFKPTVTNPVNTYGINTITPSTTNMSVIPKTTSTQNTTSTISPAPNPNYVAPKTTFSFQDTVSALNKPSTSTFKPLVTSSTLSNLATGVYNFFKPSTTVKPSTLTPITNPLEGYKNPFNVTDWFKMK